MNSQPAFTRFFPISPIRLLMVAMLAALLPALPAHAGQQTAFRFNSVAYSAAEGGTISGTVTRYAVNTTCTFACDWFPNQQSSVCLYLTGSGTYQISASDVPANWQDGVECVTFPPNVFTVNFSIPFVQNSDLEYDRTGKVSIGSGLVDTNAIQDATVTLLDDDNPIYAVIYYGGQNYCSDLDIIEGAASGANTATVRILRGTGLVQGRTINYTIGSSTTSGSDYTASPGLTGSVTIPQGSDHADFTITALPDTLHEGDETVTLQLTSGIYTIDGGCGSRTVTILDDTPNVSLWFLNPNAAEGGSQIGLVVQRDLAYVNSSSKTVNLSIGGSATYPTDYTPTLSSSVVIPAGKNAVTNWITPLADSIVEGVETITATVLPGNYYVVDSAGANATAYINNNNYPVVTVEATDSHAGEGGNTGVFTITRAGNVSALTVQFDITGTATPGVDYAALPSSVTLPSGVMTTNIVVTPISNIGTEAAETVVLNLKTNASYFLGLQTNAVVTITGDGSNPRDSYPKALRYARGSGTNLETYSIVVPLDGLKGTRRNDEDLFGYTYAYHYNATNAGNQAYATNRIAFNTPIASFGSAWGTPLYMGESYSLGVYQGIQTADPIVIYAFRRSDGGVAGTLNLELPYFGDSADWSNFTTNGYARTVTGHGLTTTLRGAPDMDWGVRGGTGWLLTHSATDEATNYTYLVVGAGLYNGQFMCINGSSQGAFGYLYELEFEQRPAWRSVFVDQPHFQSDPLPPDLWNKSPDELFNYGAPVTNAVSLTPSACTNIDQSPELRRHPILDQFVADLNNDPLALANYVQNEIGLTDPIAYRDDGSVATESVNQGGVNRGALGVYLEGQGSPVEQCALLIYLLRQAGYPAAYVFPPEGGLKLLDTRLGALLRTRINGGHDSQGRLYTTNRLITVNYPWVAAYINNQWVHLYPWIKDTAPAEGLDIYDFLPDQYKDTQLWVKDYILGKTNIMAFATLDDDTPGIIFPRWLDNTLKNNAPGISVDDIGMRFVNRRHLYSQWTDFPHPTWVTNTSTAVESLASSGITSVSPRLTNIFDTVQVELYSLNNPQKFIATSPLRMADLHNRKFYLTHTNLGGGQIQAQLVLGPYRPGSTTTGNFSASDATLTNRQALTLTLDGTDDSLRIRFRHRRQRALAWETALDPDRSFLDLYSERQVLAERPLRKGDVGAICFDTGRVTPAMLRVHAQEIWNMEQMLSTNSGAASQVSVDVYQGTLVYLMGMSYYERVARFDASFRNLFKVQDLSSFAMGLAKISPRRNPDGTLYNGTVDPVWPNVDMFFQEVATVGNGTARLDSGWDSRAATRNYFNLSIADLSAQEHATLNVFYGQSNAVSTVKLLQLAQKKAASGGSNVVELTVHNYLSAGNVVYGGAPLKDHDPALWTQITKFFEQSGTLGYVVGWMPPGPQTNASGSFSGMGAFILGVDRFAALIGNNQYGAYSDNLGFGRVASANTPNYGLSLFQDSYLMSLTQPTPSVWEPAYENSSIFNSVSDYNLLSTGALKANPGQELQATLNNYLYNTSGSYLNNYTTTMDVGGFGATDSRESSGGFQKILDPVNAMTGEFYVDEVDLSLPGPMPLQVRRNYGSHNLAANQIGFGWRLNYMPYLTVAPNTNVIYAAEPSGSVLAFAPVSTNLWAPTPALNPTLNNQTENGIGSVANHFNARLAKVWTTPPTYYLTNGDGSLRVFQEMSFPLTNSTAWDRLRPYLTTWYDNRSNYYRFEYGTNVTAADYGQVRRIVSSSGNIVRFVYDVYGHVVEAYSLDGRRVQYDFDDHGDLVTVTRPDSSELKYEYQLATWTTNGLTNVYSTHLITKELKPDGRVLKNEYDDQRRVTNQWSTVGPDLRLVRNGTFRYTNDFKLTNLTATVSGTTTILDYTNNPTTYFYTNGLIRRIRDPLGGELVQEWYEAGETNAPAYPRSLKKVTDKHGLVTEFKYDSRGNVTNSIVKGDLLGDGNTNATTVSTALYNANNLPVQSVDASGTTNLFFYTNTWLLARVEIWPSNATPAQAITNLYSYTMVTNAADGTVSHGLRVREVRAAYSSDSATNEWAYSSRGFPTQQTRYTSTGDPAVVVTNLFNYRGEVAQQSDAAGRVTRFGFDPLGRPESREVFEVGQSVPMAWEFSYYNENGELTWTDGPRFDPEDYVWRDYDGAGRKSQEIRWRSRGKSDGSGVEAETGDNLYATTFYEYDPLNNLTKVSNPLGNYSLKRYDVLGQLTREEFYDANGSLLATNGFRYNLAGDVTNAFNALGGVTEKQFTATGKPKFQRNSDGSTNAWRYYADGRLRRKIQRNGAYWETTYDDANRRAARTFYTSTGVPLATNITLLDRRGNVVQRIDAGGNLFTSTFDGLDRLKASVGPSIITVREECGQVPGCGNWVTNILQQSTTNFYDAAGVWQTNVNALGEKTIAHFDALGRAVRSEIRNSAGALVRETTTAYMTNHHGMTVTQGSGGNAIAATTYTDNDGQTVLDIRYPAAGYLEYTWQRFDRAGRRTESQQLSKAGASQPYLWSFGLWNYDGLNRVKTETARDYATTTFNYDPMGNVTNRAMPGDLKWSAIYNNAGQMLQDWNTGNDGSGTRTNSYAYYSNGSSFAGLLQTRTDPRGYASTYSYDPWLRLTNLASTTVDPYTTLTTTWGYDVRGFATNITELDAGAPTGANPRVILRTFDPYGQMVSESVSLNGVRLSAASQGWDAAGQRSKLDFGNAAYGFGRRADGALASATGPAGTGVYNYDTAGVLTSRSFGGRTATVSSRDGTGRPLQVDTDIYGTYVLHDSLSWFLNGQLAYHTISRWDYTDSRSYSYANFSRRLSQEQLDVTASQRWTNNFIYDGGVGGGLGALTKAGAPNSGSATWSGGVDAFSRVSSETNNVLRRPAYGDVNGAATLTATLDGQPVGVSVNGTNGGQWRTTVALTPGAHQLIVAANHPSGLFTTNAVSWFTNTATAADRVDDYYTSAGEVSRRIWKKADGTTNRTQLLYWDAKERLYQVQEYDAQRNGFLWIADYDALNRRLRTRTYPTTNGVTHISGVTPKTIQSVYDPLVEFLEVGISHDGLTTWKQYGPDLSGRYGGMQGVGGLEAVKRGLSATVVLVNDALGNVHEQYDVGNGNLTLSSVRHTAYGAVPGREPVALGYSGSFVDTFAWRGKWKDITGYYQIGLRLYEPESGRWLSHDSVWNSGDPNGYTFCAGDPLNGGDWDGRFAYQLGQNKAAQMVGNAEGLAEWSLDLAAVGEMSSPANLTMNLLSGKGLAPNSTAAKTWLNDQFSTITSDFSREEGYNYAGGFFVGNFAPNLIPIGGAEAGGASLLGRAEAALVKRFPALGTDVGATLARWFGREATGLAPKTFLPGEVMPNGEVAGMGPGAMYVGEKPLPEILYRGVGAGTKNDIQQAAGGAIIPRGGTATMFEHVNQEMTTSIYTSWTPDITVARRFAGGEGGVIFQVNPNAIPNRVISTAPFSRKPFESEFLIEGTVYGVKRFR